jgi:hypothetical protein
VFGETHSRTDTVRQYRPRWFAYEVDGQHRHASREHRPIGSVSCDNLPVIGLSGGAGQKNRAVILMVTVHIDKNRIVS